MSSAHHTRTPPVPTLGLLAALMAATLFAPASASAQEDTGFWLRPAAGVASIDGELHTRLTLSALYARDSLFTLSGDRWTEQPADIGLRLQSWVPLHISLASDPESRVRTEDWDEPGDYLRLLRIFELGTPADPLHVRAGELTDVRIGHGTIVDHYINTLQLDHFQWGLHSAVNAVRGGGELLVDSVVDPAALGARGWVRPLVFARPDDPIARRLSLGASIFTDPRAPTRLETDDAGLYQVNDQNRLLVDRREHATIVGADIEFAVVRTSRVGLTPYLDANHHVGQGSGLHSGLFVDVEATEGVSIYARGEYRRLGRGYLPTWFGPLHTVERMTYQPLRGAGPEDSTQRLPKLQWARAADIPARNGYLVETGGEFGGFARVMFAWEDADSPVSAAVRARLQLDPPGPFTLGAFYARSAFNAADGVFSLDDAVLVSEARILPKPWLYLGGELSRRWTVRQDGTHEPVNDFALMLGLIFGL